MEPRRWRTTKGEVELSSTGHKLDAAPEFAELLRAAIDCTARGDQEGALRSYDQLLRVNPDHVVALNNLGIVLRSMNRHDEALACYRRIMNVAPHYSPACVNAGGHWRKSGG